MSDELINLSLDDKVAEFVGDVFGGVHRVAKLEQNTNHYVCIPRGTLATFDDDKLTRIVLASHCLGLRAEITNNGMRGLKILLHNRASRTGRMFERHPSIHEVLGKEPIK